MIFSEKLQLIRKNKGLTQEELAEKLDISRQAVAKWESGQAYPDISNLIQISNLFNVTVDYLVSWSVFYFTLIYNYRGWAKTDESTSIQRRKRLLANKGLDHRRKNARYVVCKQDLFSHSKGII